MDLLDDSGDEAGKLVGDVDEEVLLNSDDEEGGSMRPHGHYTVDEEELLYEGDEEEYLGDEPDDVLDLELGEDELETPDSTLGNGNVAPVKLRPAYEEHHDTSEADAGDHETSVMEDETGVTSTEDHEVSESPSSSSRMKSTADSDDDEDSPRQRTRFLTERKTEDIPKHPSSEGNPITTLGVRNQSQRPMHSNPHAGRGNRGGFGNRGKHFGPRGPSMQNMRLRPPSLLGDRPRPALLRFPPFNQPQFQHNEHMQQLQGGFIDFNKPIRRMNKSPMKKGPPHVSQVNVNVSGSNVNEAGKPGATPANTTVSNPTPQGNINTVMNNQNIRPGSVVPKRPPAPRSMMNRPMRPMRAPLRPNPFIIVDPSLQGPRGPRGMHQRPPVQQNQQFRHQHWSNQPQGPRGIPMVIPGGIPMMQGGPLEPQDNFNFNNGSQGILGPSPSGGPPFGEMPPNGFRPPFLPQNQQRFPPPPEEMMHVPPQHFMQQQNFPMSQESMMNPPHQPPFHGMRPPNEMEFRHRAPSPQMHFNNQLPPQPMRQNEYRFQGQMPPEQGWPMQQHPHPDMPFQQSQQPPQQPAKMNPRPNPFRLEDEQHDRPNPFFPRRHEERSSDHYDNGRYDDHHHRERSPEYSSRDRHRYDSSGSGRDYHEKDYDYDRRYDYEHESRSYRPPSKRPHDDRDDYRPEKRGYGSPEKRLDGRLGPPVAKTKEVPETIKRQEEAMKMTRESQKVMGLDNDYLRRMEEQKEMRERILREKEHRRKKQVGGGNSPGDSYQEENLESRREVRLVKNSGPNGGDGGAASTKSSQAKSEPRHQEGRNPSQSSVNVSTASNGAQVASKSIYINPRAFRGDLSAFNNSNMQSMNTTTGGNNNNNRNRTTTAAPMRTSTTTTRSVEPSVASASTVSGSTVSGGHVVAKKRTILRIVRNKKGEIISKSKVVVLPKGSLVGGSTTTTNQHHAS